ncbi:DUF2513 domain-containing protein [Sphingobacterium endophyticum]|uniref:DUF2513 domain-containing protein n=1 Tax=Sphingobacterium endophyticum TaxID=2546448 RepID=UPI0012E1335A|nr:DUF2513 domain-containing protein [Sphingobacterium endophyticum]
MKLDLELCRKILKVIQEADYEDYYEGAIEIPGYTQKEIFYQIQKMSEAGYVGYEAPTGHMDECFSIDISFKGHEFLNEMLNDNIWNATTELIKKKGGVLTFEIVKAFIPTAIKNVLGIDVNG